MVRYNEREYKDHVDSQNFHKDSGKMDNEESDKYEIEVEETLDRWHHNLLGEKLDDKGVWNRDYKMTRIINEAGAGIIIQTVRGVINKNMHFARYDEQEQKEIEADLGIALAPVIFENYVEFEIPEPADRYCRLVMEQVFNQFRLLLSIARFGNMITYRGDKTKTIISRHEVTGQSSAY